MAAQDATTRSTGLKTRHYKRRRGRPPGRVPLRRRERAARLKAAATGRGQDRAEIDSMGAAGLSFRVETRLKSNNPKQK
jgi:hypothetical protein